MIRPSQYTCLVVAAFFALLGGLSSDTPACPTCGTLGDPFALPHPHAIQIAVATRRARDDGVLPVVCKSPQEVNRIDITMIRFASLHLLDRGKGAASSVTIDVLLVDEPALYRIEARNGQVQLTSLDGKEHRLAQARLVTTFPVVDSLTRQMITIPEAIQRGCLEVEGDRVLLTRSSERQVDAN